MAKVVLPVAKVGAVCGTRSGCGVIQKGGVTNPHPVEDDSRS